MSSRVVDGRILFVGSDPFWFIQIERDALLIQPNWSCHRVENNSEALDALQTTSFNALILDGRSTDGMELLQKLGKELNWMVCLVRCDLSDRAAVAQWTKAGANPIQGNSDASALIANLKRAERLREWMADPAIKKILPMIRKLPTAPRLHAQVTEELQSPNGSMETVAELISHDPVMSAKILQVVNSAFFGRAREVTDTSEAVMVLGAERIRSLILLAGVFSQYDESKCPGFAPEPIWSHSVHVGMYARAIAFSETKDVRIAEAAFTAGLLHDIGKLILAGNLPEMIAAVRRAQTNRKTSPREAELTVMGITHAELGACLLATWGLPLTILEAIAWHHEPNKWNDKGFSLLAAVHVANVLAQKGNGTVYDEIDLAFLKRIGFADRCDRWRSFCGLDVASVKEEKKAVEEQVRRRREVKEN